MFWLASYDVFRAQRVKDPGGRGRRGATVLPDPFSDPKILSLHTPVPARILLNYEQDSKT